MGRGSSAFLWGSGLDCQKNLRWRAFFYHNWLVSGCILFLFPLVTPYSTKMMMDVPVISAGLALFYGAYFLSHNFEDARNKWTALWRFCMSVWPWLIARGQQFYPVVVNEKTEMGTYFLCWVLGNRWYKGLHHKASIDLGGNFSGLLLAFEVMLDGNDLF